MSKLQLLKDLFSDPAKWCKHVFARKEDGTAVNGQWFDPKSIVNDPAAHSLCIRGGMIKIGIEENWDDPDAKALYEALDLDPVSTYPHYTLANWNNDENRVHLDIVKLIDRAIDIQNLNSTAL